MFRQLAYLFINSTFVKMYITCILLKNNYKDSYVLYRNKKIRVAISDYPKFYKNNFTSFFLFSFTVSSLSSNTPNLSNPTVIIKAMKFVPIRSIKSSVFDLSSMESNISLLLSFFSLLRSRFKFCLLWYPLNSNVIAEFKNISANITIANFLLL